jgi:5-methylcytosine-specific restriction endonuclease McrA
MSCLQTKSAKVKAAANYTCQECGSKQSIQTHHQVPKDDDSLICLCKACHSLKHPVKSEGIDPELWIRMRASAIRKGQKIHEWLEDAIRNWLKMEDSNEK